MRYQSGTLPTSYGYTGQRADAATGLDYYNARYYDPVAGQFTSADTTLAGGLNRYAYVGGNPETFVDPTGNHAQSCDLALCGGEGINLDGSLSSAQGGAPGDASGSGGSSGSRGAGSGASTSETQASASASTDAAESDGMLAGETFSIDPEGVGTPQGLETGEQYHLDEVRQAETKTPDGKNTASPNDTSTPTTPQNAETYRTSGVKDAKGNRPAAAAIATQEGATPVSSTSSQPGVENPGFNIEGHQYNAKCAEVACASQIMLNVQSGEDGWNTGNDVTINLSQVNGLGPCNSCSRVMSQLASGINATVTVRYIGVDGSIQTEQFLPGSIPFGG